MGVKTKKVAGGTLASKGGGNFLGITKKERPALGKKKTRKLQECIIRHQLVSKQRNGRSQRNWTIVDSTKLGWVQKKVGSNQG